jgi:L-lactate dehydrogenase complex protein LldE
MTIAIQASCWAQSFRPSVTKSVLDLGRRLGLDLSTPKDQTCCGLPIWEAGHTDAAIEAARQTLRVFDGFEMIVSPSPSCLRMMREHIQALLHHHPDANAARSLAERSVGWHDYLAQEIGAESLMLRYAGKIAFFRPCRQEDDTSVRLLLSSVRGAKILPDPTEQCCGYGNNLAWRYPELSKAIAGPVVGAIRLSHADLIVTTDVGCLLHLEPLLHTAGTPPILHLAEFLAQSADC